MKTISKTVIIVSVLLTSTQVGAQNREVQYYTPEQQATAATHNPSEKANAKTFTEQPAAVNMEQQNTKIEQPSTAQPGTPITPVPAAQNYVSTSTHSELTPAQKTEQQRLADERNHKYNTTTAINGPNFKSAEKIPAPVLQKPNGKPQSMNSSKTTSSGIQTASPQKPLQQAYPKVQTTSAELTPTQKAELQHLADERNSKHTMNANGSGAKPGDAGSKK